MQKILVADKYFVTSVVSWMPNDVYENPQINYLLEIKQKPNLFYFSIKRIYFDNFYILTYMQYNEKLCSKYVENFEPN